MSEDIPYRLRGFIQDAESLLSQVKKVKQEAQDVTAKLRRQIFSQAAGGFVAGLFETASSPITKYTKAYLDQNQRVQIQNKVDLLITQFNNILSSTESFLSQVSIMRPRLQPDGNSLIFVKKLAKIHRYSNLETKVRNFGSVKFRAPDCCVMAMG